MAELNILEAIRTAMDEELERDPNVMVLGEDVGRKGGVFGATDGLWAKHGDKRVLDTPLTEAMIAGAAMGAALYGLRPIAEMQFADFVYPAFNQIVSEISRLHYRSNGTFSLPMVIRMPYGGGVHGALYHSQSNEAYFTSTVGLKVVAPGTPADAKGLLKTAVRDPDPVLFFEHKKTYRLFKAEVPDGDHLVPIGPAVVARPGKHLSILCYGYMRHCALEAAETLAREDGVEAEIVDLRTLRPLDTATVLASVRKTARALVVHEANRFGGFGAEVAATIAEEAFEHLDAPVTRLAGPEVPGVPFHHSLEDWFMLNPAKIVEAARRLAAY
ncbi:MAG TPA: alpha-ketoacid dehydrogenase subunit beta [Candidatus Limnocylindria bacterium]|nr:alpha-ketoacid dehydrogenase subunit beta [Candidatus Limnocylindria bacterium]